MEKKKREAKPKRWQDARKGHATARNDIVDDDVAKIASSARQEMCDRAFRKMWQ